MNWRGWKGDVWAGLIGLGLAATGLYLLGSLAVLASSAFRCDDQCKVDRFNAVQQ